ncbi:MAG: polysaccharide deacetylase family protein [Anaerolineae bacterium]|nr:polysaccharide deacetylase family protein [Anaerolineae bacterium]
MEHFTWQIEWLKRHYPSNGVTLTFDDGFADFCDAWAHLRDAGKFPVIMFAVSDSQGAPAWWHSTTSHPTLSRQDLRDLARQGVEIGSHTATHPHLPQIDLDAAHEEITRSKAELEEITGAPVQSFAYPYGKVSPPIVKIVREAGFSRAYTVRSGPGQNSDPFMLQRIMVLRSDSKLLFVLKMLTGCGSWIDLLRRCAWRLR